MGCAAIDLSRWKDFPKRLRVLLLEESAHSAAKVSSKLESMDYVVSTFLDEDEALAAVFSDGNSFHVAIVEVKAVNRHGCFKFLEAVQGLPTIMISDVNCLSTMMKCIALGAAEFLQKPLSEDKLKNIWQHVVHKAFNAGESALSKSLKPIKAAAVSILQMEQNVADSNSYSDGLKSGSSALPWEACLVEHENGIDPSLTSDNFADPSIPELQKGACDLDDCHIQDRHNWSAHDERADDGEPHEPKNLSCVNSKSVDITCNSSVCELASCMENATPRLDSVENNEEVNSACDAKLDRKPATVNSQDQDNVEKKTGDPDNKKRALNNASNAKASKKKTKFDWTPELHRRFVQAVEQLGIDQAIPSKILELMKVEGLTRHNVASHLQKYRMHRRHTMHKVDEAATRRTWHHHRQSTQRVLSTNRPIMAFPPPQPNCSIPTPSFYPVWGHPPSQPWSAHTGFPPIYPPEKWVWVRHADAWGCPVVPVQTPPTSYFTQNKTSSLYIEENDDEESWMNFLDLCPAEEEVIDRAVKEAISKPWLPLPLGLKPPSVDSVLSELHRHGVSRIPPFNS